MRPAPHGRGHGTEANLSERDDADVEEAERLAGDELDDLGLRLRTAQLREDVGIEQPVGHTAITA